ncbi:hypothetical protein BSKO_06441 [Bryopsis sp. KO-2023]|nr:hypothetical protein BSKO_06441 [Bryopsis sp. KO-2023]
MEILSLVGALAVGCFCFHALATIASHVFLNSVKGHVVLVTGCDRGLGKQMCMHLAEKGMKIFAGCLTERGCSELSKEANSDRVLPFVMDVTVAASVTNARKFVLSNLASDERLNAIVNNAGVAGNCYVEFMPVATLKKTMDVNYMGVVRVCKEFLPMLVESKGRVVNMISPAAFQATPGMADYSASKAAANAFSDALRKEMFPFGVKVAQLLPGFMRTEMVMSNSSELQKNYKNASEDVKERYSSALVEQNKKLNAMAEALSGPSSQILPHLDHALSSKFPKAFYYIGWDTRFVYLPLMFLTRLVGYDNIH